MKKSIIYILTTILMTSCIIRKDIVRPYIKFKIYDSKNKVVLSNVGLFRTNSKGTLKRFLNLEIISNKKGIIILPKSEMPIYGTYKYIFPLINTHFVFKKEGYLDFELNFHKYFNINSKKDYKKRFKTDIFMTKIDTLPK